MLINRLVDGSNDNYSYLCTMHPRSVFPQSSENLNPNLSPLTAALCWGNSACNVIVISHFWLGGQSESLQICNEITKHWSTTWMSRSVFFVSFWQEMKSDRLDLRNSLTSLLYGSSVGHWLIKGIERFLLRWLGSHGIKLVLSHVTQNVLLSIKRRSRELTCWKKSGILSGRITHSCSWSSRTTASSSFFSRRLQLWSSSRRAFSFLFSNSAFFSWDSRKRTSSSK